MVFLSPSDFQEDNLKKVLEIDDIIHSPARLAILIFLLPRGKGQFTLIRKTLALTAGNLSSHIQKLEKTAFSQNSKNVRGCQAKYDNISN
ncbi:MAG: transcriptional regulator [Candidatus Hodarchaeota archaeon]